MRALEALEPVAGGHSVVRARREVAEETSGDAQALLAEARATKAMHIDDGSGMCLRCLTDAARISWSPCAHALRAEVILRRATADPLGSLLGTAAV